MKYHDIWPQTIMPSISTLLPTPPRKLFSNMGPPVSIPLNQLHQQPENKDFFSNMKFDERDTWLCVLKVIMQCIRIR